MIAAELVCTDNINNEIPEATEVVVLDDEVAATGLAVALIHRWNVAARGAQARVVADLLQLVCSSFLLFSPRVRALPPSTNPSPCADLVTFLPFVAASSYRRVLNIIIFSPGSELKSVHLTHTCDRLPLCERPRDRRNAVASKCRRLADDCHWVTETARKFADRHMSAAARRWLTSLGHAQKKEEEEGEGGASITVGWDAVEWSKHEGVTGHEEGFVKRVAHRDSFRARDATILKMDPAVVPNPDGPPQEAVSALQDQTETDGIDAMQSEMGKAEIEVRLNLGVLLDIITR